VSSGIQPNGNQWAMTYTPYNQDGTCKSASDVAADIKSIKSKGFTTVRIYATDCSGPTNVGAACAAEGLKIILGVYIDGSGISSGCHEQINTLTTWGASNWDLVEMVVVGNEAVFNGYTDAGSLAALISETKTKFQAAGYNGPVTTTETVAVICENAALFCPVIDVVAANIHPFFNAQVSASGAGAFVATEMTLLEAACPGKTAYNLETGWPSAGNANGAAVPGSAEQKQAIDSIVAAVGGKSAIFSFEDDTWKTPGALGVEQYWGCADVFASSY
jgi:exo-beta-1,3-glucanase (GH17 family)